MPFLIFGNNRIRRRDVGMLFLYLEGRRGLFGRPAISVADGRGYRDDFVADSVGGDEADSQWCLGCSPSAFEKLRVGSTRGVKRTRELAEHSEETKWGAEEFGMENFDDRRIV